MVHQISTWASRGSLLSAGIWRREKVVRADVNYSHCLEHGLGITVAGQTEQARVGGFLLQVKPQKVDLQ